MTERGRPRRNRLTDRRSTGETDKEGRVVHYPLCGWSPELDLAPPPSQILSLFFIRSLIDKNAEMNVAAAAEARLFSVRLASASKINALIGSGVLDSGADGRERRLVSV